MLISYVDVVVFYCHSCTELVEVWFTLPIAIGIIICVFAGGNMTISFLYEDEQREYLIARDTWQLYAWQCDSLSLLRFHKVHHR